MAGLHNSNNNETVKAICRHAFLQIMMQSGYMKLEDAKKMFAEISKGGFGENACLNCDRSLMLTMGCSA